MLESAEPLRVLVLPHVGECYNLEIEAAFKAEQHLAASGVKMSLDPDEPWDLAWVFYERLNEVGTDKPVVVDIAYDGAGLIPSVREMLAMPHVVCATKSNVFKPRQLYNVPTFQSMLHGRWMQECRPDLFDPVVYPERLENHRVLSVAELDKLAVSYSYSVYPRLQPLIDGVDDDMNAPREYDAIFVGTVEYGLSSVQVHRGLCVDVMREIEKSRSVFLSTGRSVAFDRYCKLLSKSKVCVSPWGFGERCHRDSEALLAGCVLVKPQSSQVETWPDIYREGETYLRCRPDFADLPEIVARVCNNWPRYYEWRKGNRRWLVEETRTWRLAARLGRIFRGSMAAWTTNGPLII